MEKEDYFEELKELVNDSFLDKNLKCRKITNEETLEEEIEEYVTLTSIINLKLSEEDEIFVINYLGSCGISVKGDCSYYSGICDNYIQSEHSSEINVQKLSEEAQKQYIEEYQREKNTEVRNLLVESNLPLVKYLSRKYSYLYDVNQEYLESYGVEGLIMAMDTYDSTRGKFSNYLSIRIRSSILGSIIIFYLGENGYKLLNKISQSRGENTKYFEYFYAKRGVEKEEEKRLEDNPELIEKVMLGLEKSGYCEGKLLEELKTRVSIHMPYSIEQLGDGLSYLDDDTLYGEVIEKVYQQELRNFIEEITEKLPRKRRETLRSYYGLGGRVGISLENIGLKEGVTHEAIRLRCRDGKQSLKSKMIYWKNYSVTKSFIENSHHEYEGVTHNAYIKRK